MGYPVDRIQLFNQNGVPLPELYPNEVESRIRHEEINGEHTLTIITKRKLDVGWRALTVDGMGKWREWVVEEADELHEAGLSAVGTYRLVWSLQYDLSYTFDDSGDLGHREIGIASSASGAAAVEAAIAGSEKWTVSAMSDVAPIAAGGGVVMIAESAWDRLSKVVAAWGGEVDAIINVGSMGVMSREVLFATHLGKTEPTRRFEWGCDLTSIQRTPDPGPYFCRVVPIGKGTTEYAEGPSGDDPTEDEIEFEWPLSLLDDPEYDPHDHEWIEDPDVVEAFRVSDGKGGWEYPTKIVKYDEEDVQLLYEAAMDDLHNHTRPNITYTASVAQFVRAGFDAKGVALGDEIQVVDRGFNPDAELRIQERVTAVDIDELDDDRTELTIGQAQESLADTLAGMNTSFDEAVERLSFYSTPAYVRDLIGRLNDEINRSGGYTYLVPGMGQITYDVAVSDPKVGAEATKAVEIRGGSIRIGTRTSSDGSWEWKSVFVDGHIAADLVTAAKITTGTIGSAASGNYWNLDTGTFRMGDTTQIGESEFTVGELAETAIISVDVQYAEGSSRAEAPETGWTTTPPPWREGYYIWTKTVTVTNAGESESDPVCISGRDGVSFNNATLLIYKRATSVPRVPSGSLTYSFDGGTLTGDLSGWATTIPEGTDPCWASSAVASSTTDSDVILPNEWAEPARVFATGDNGMSNAVVMLYQRSVGQPIKPSGTLTYTFATGTLSGSLGSWSQTIPSGSEPCWVIAATAASSAATDTIAGNEFSDPVKLVENGSNGTNGVNSATVYLYQRKASAPDKPTITYVYTFATGKVTTAGSGSANGWSSTIPGGNTPCWIIAATASSADATDTILGREFSDPVKLVEDGVNSATVYLYQRKASAPDKPTISYKYTFSTKTLEVTGTGAENGWSQTMPSGTDPCWVISATASSTDVSDTIPGREFSSPVKLAENGLDGLNQATIRLYQRSASAPKTPRSSLTYTFETGELTGTMTNGWSVSLTSGTNPCWVTSAVAISSDATDTIGAEEWSEPAKLAENGINQATLRLYQRKATKPTAMPTYDITYTFSDGSTSGNINNGWSKTIPEGLNPCWTISAVAISSTASDTIKSSEWSEPVKLVENGGDGVNTVTVYLYQRKDAAPNKPTCNYQYVFDTCKLVQTGTGSSNGWSTTIPAGSSPCWIMSAVASSTGDSDIIPGSEFSDPVKLVENGVDGLNQATLRLYKRSASTPTAKPTNALTYTFETGVLSGSITGGWSTTLPSGAEPCWVISATAISSDATDRIGTSEWSDPVKLVENGVAGANTVTIFLYKRSTSTPTVPGSNLTYKFSTNSLSGTLSGWTRTIPAGTNPCWVTSAVASSTTDSDTIASTEWSTVQKFVENGMNTATVYIYQRSATTPAAQGNGLTYTFSTKKLTGAINNGWSATIPDGTNPCWVSCATAVSTSDTDTIEYTEWSEPVKLASNGLNTATVTLYQRSASEPTSFPTGRLTYRFSTSTLTGSGMSGWSATMPTGANPCWMITATVVAYGDTDTIEASEWSEPIKMVENGLNQATVYLYKSAKAAPSGTSARPTGSLTYTFSTHVLSGSQSVFNGWSQTMPSGDTLVWVICATAVSSADTDSIPSTEWSTPVQMTGKDGVGIKKITEQYSVVTDGSSPGSLTVWYDTPQEWVKGKSIWTRSKIEWTDGSVTYTDPVIANSINGAYRSIEELDASLDDKDVFDRLTNNGTLKTFVKDPETGKLFINADYIATGILTSVSGDSYWDIERNLMHLIGDLVMVMNGYDSTAKHYAQLGTFSAYNSLGTKSTLRGMRLFTNGETSGGGAGDNSLSFAAHDNTYLSNAPYDPYMPSAIITSEHGLVVQGMTAVSQRRYIAFSDGEMTVYSHDGATRYDNGSSISLNNDQMYLRVTKSGTTLNVLELKPDSSVNTYSTSSAVVNGDLVVRGALSVSNSKNRVVETDDYGTRKFYCYETASPYFGDVGSGRTDGEGVCYVMIDDVAQQALGTCDRYQVFLQACGDGRVWVDEKHRDYFVVRGTPDLPFDWELKALQTGFTTERLEPADALAVDGTVEDDIGTIYDEELNFASYLEEIYAHD